MLNLSIELKRQIDEFRPYVGVIEALKNPGMKDRHFETISEKIGFEIVLTPELTFKDLLQFEITKFEEIIKEISETAAKEHFIEISLEKMYSEWEPLNMEIIPYKDTGKLFYEINISLTAITILLKTFTRGYFYSI